MIISKELLRTQQVPLGTYSDAAALRRKAHLGFC